MEVNEFCKRKGEVEFFDKSEGASDDESAEVSCFDVGGDDAISKHEGKAFGMVCKSVDV